MPSFWLEYDNNGDIQEFSFDADSVTIGRDKASDFVLDHPTVSRQHAVIVHKSGSYHLVVLSRGGLTAIDGQQVHGEVMLYDHSALNLGQLQFRFRSDFAPQKPAGGQQASFAASFANSAGGAGAAGGYGGQAQGQSLGAQAQGGGFGGPAQGGGFGAQAQGGGFGGQAQQGGAGGFSGAGAQQGGGQAGFGLGNSPADGTATPNGGGANGGGEAANEAGIVSWDEIASSSEAMDDDGQPKETTVYERMQGGKKKDEKTNPVLVAVAGAGIIGLLYYSFFMGSPGGPPPVKPDKALKDPTPVVIEVSCMGEAACMHNAEESYKVGLEKLEKKDVAIPNLFEGYKKLLEAKQYLDKAGKKKVPADMSKLEDKRKQARAELTEIFKNYRVKFHQAKKRKLYKDMVKALDAVKTYFPDKTAREHKWAMAEELDMKKQGVYPKHVYGP